MNDTIRGAATRLGVLPLSLRRLTDITATPDFSFVDVVDVVSHDMILTAAVLRVANSAANAPAGGISTVREAVLRIGVAGTLVAAMHTIASGPMQDSLPTYGDAPGHLWRHASASSIAAELIRTASAAVLPVSFNTTALLHDIGKLVLDTVARDAGLVPGPLVEVRGPELCAREVELFGLHHGHAGAIVAEQWNLPAAVVEGIRAHHEPPEDGIPAAVGLADAIGHAALDPADGPAGDHGWNATLARQVLGVPQARVDSMIETTRERLGSLLDRFAVTD
jgi:HD-like signal output (HDOD) protein